VRLIILNQFFYPDHSATSQLMTELAESLVAAGDEVTVIAGRGRYNGGELLPPREEYKGVRIERAWATSFGKARLWRRLCDYLTFYVGAFWKLFVLPRHDILMALTTPPLIALPALLVGRLRGMRVINLVQDVYPDVAVALGAFRVHGLRVRTFDYLNRFVLRHVDRIIVLGECMRARIRAKTGDAVPIEVIHNWADGAAIQPLPKNLDEEPNPFLKENNLNDEFVVLFSGNFGRVNEFSTLLEAARRLREWRDIVFLFVGEGAKGDEIKDFIARHNLSNVRVLPYQPRERLRYSLSAGDALVVTLGEGLAGLSVPSKIYAVFAAGRPALFIGDKNSTAAQLIERYKCGAVVGAGECEQLVAVISEWATVRNRCEELGRAARRAFDERFERAHAVRAYRQTFKRVLDEK
jgi:colanic acid biosynthesis glycosyl transferase WcaI